MKKLLIIFLLIPLFLQAQEIGRFPFPRAVVVAAPSDGNLISNGTFDDASDWTTTNGGWVISGGNATYGDAIASSLYQKDSEMVSEIQPSTQYKLSFDLSGTSGGGIYLRIANYNEYDNGDETYVGFSEYSNGSIEIIFTTPSTINGSGIVLTALTEGDSGGVIDNIELTVNE